jgi:hypothetical protein
MHEYSSTDLLTLFSANVSSVAELQIFFEAHLQTSDMLLTSVVVANRWIKVDMYFKFIYY